MSEQTTTASDEIDLLHLYKKLKQITRGWIRSLFKALDFVLRNWLILLILLAVGIGVGYYLQYDKKTSKEAKVLLKVNFDSGNYLYNAVEVLERKISERDSEFLMSIGMDSLYPAVTGLTLEPIIDVKDITENFEATDRNLDPILRYVEFNMEEEELYQTFATDYNYHYLKATLTSKGSKEDLEKIMAFINSSPILKEYKTNAVQTIQDKIDANQATIMQIDQFLAEYLKQEITPNSPPSAQYYVERDTRPDLLLTNKNELLLENRELKNELVFYKEAIIPMSGMEVYPAEKTLMDKKIIVMPILLIVVFLSLVLFRHVYFSLRAIANREDA